jgi:anti-anti-sigma factor
MTMQTVTITVLPTTAPRGVRVVVAGDLDIATTEQLHTELDAVLTHRPVEADLSAVTFFSCATAQLLGDIQLRAPGSLTFIGAGRPIRRLLEIMGLQALLGTVAAAWAAHRCRAGHSKVAGSAACRPPDMQRCDALVFSRRGGAGGWPGGGPAR